MPNMDKSAVDATLSDDQVEEDRLDELAKLRAENDSALRTYEGYPKDDHRD